MANERKKQQGAGNIATTQDVGTLLIPESLEVGAGIAMPNITDTLNYQQ
ncbi:hypothetical protein [Nodularia sp. UHCC 0506]|nr:hypothetical protein [Nodularia sp. UHCC 0506]MEA5514680.1 hypothetical protein [Nodularia sp. UHCC 0506]